MKSGFALLLFLLMLSPLHSSAQKWSLEKCINYAMINNLQVRQAEVTTKMAASDHLQSKLNLLPTIDVTGTYSDNFGNGVNFQTLTYALGNNQSLSLALNGNLPLFTGLQQVYNVQRAKYDLLASEFDYKNAQNNICLNVAQAYLQILLDREIENVAAKQKALDQSQDTITQNRIRAGALPETAIYDIESQIARDEVTIVSDRTTTNLALLTLQQLLQIKVTSGFDVEAPDVHAENVTEVIGSNAEGIYTYALDNQPSIKSADARVTSADYQRKIAYGGLSPTLSGFVGLSTEYFSADQNVVYQSDTIAGFPIQLPVSSGRRAIGDDLRSNFRQGVGLTLDVPLFSKGQKFINIQKAQLQVQLRRLQLESAKNQLRQDIETAYSNALGAAEVFIANKKSLEAAQKAYQATETRFKSGLAQNYDLQQAKNNLVAAESQMIQAKYTYVFRLKILDFYQGKPITLN